MPIPSGLGRIHQEEQLSDRVLPARGSPRGAKRAITALAHQLLVIAYYLLKRKEEYRELGPNHFDNINADRVRHSSVKRLERLGHVVTLEPATPLA